MPPRGASALFDHYREEVEAMHAAERPLGATERMLERAELGEEERSTLWLFAWALYENLGGGESAELRLIEGGGSG
jgi:hypothetical protein